MKSNVVTLTESELIGLIKNLVNEQDGNKELPRRNYDHNINAWRLQAYKDKGLTLYYFNPIEGKDFGLVEFKSPLQYGKFNDKAKVVFALRPDEYEKVNRLVDNIKELIKLHDEKIKTLKQMVPAVMQKLIDKDNGQ
jgi:hypothetical protein